MEIVFEGEIPFAAEETITKAARECLINTVRHAGGDKVYVRTEKSDGRFTAVLTNNGRPPEGEITEGGGLSSLRKSVESAGGIMKITGSPGFSVTIILPYSEADRKEERDD